MAVARGTQKYAKRRTPSAGARRGPEDTIIENDTGRPVSERDRRAAVKAELAATVCERIRESIAGRRDCGIEEEWREAEDLYGGFDDVNSPRRGGMQIPDKTSIKPRRADKEGAQSTLIVNITKPKTRVAASRIKEMLVPTNEKPWDVKPTPVPELEEVQKDPKLAGAMVPLADGTQAPALAVADMMMERAKKASSKEALWIEDRFVEGKVYGEMRAALDDGTRIGTGVLKGPFSEHRTTRRFSKDPQTGTASLVVEEKDEPTSKRISAKNCFPDPACGENIHDGSYFNEREYVTARELRKLAKSDYGYDKRAIAQALMEGPLTAAQWEATGEVDRRREGENVRDAARFELWYSYGDASAEALIAMGVKDPLLGNDGDTYDAETPADAQADGSIRKVQPERRQRVNGAMPGDQRRPADDLYDDEDGPLTTEEAAALASIPCCVVMLNGRCIKATIEPLESGSFPFDFFRFEKIEGQPWGRGVPHQVRAAQLIVKSGVRRLMENGGMSAGPQIAYIPGVLEPQNGRYEITGRKLWKFLPNDLVKDIRAAMAFFTVPSVQKELMEIIQLGLEFADLLSNIPLLLHGDEQPGGAPETLGGRKLFQDNAMSPLRDIAKNWDDDIIIPHLGRYHEWWMEHSDEPEKGDSEIQALGSTALVQREEGRMFLLSLWPLKDDPSLKIDPAKLASETARAHGYDMTAIQYSDDDWKKIQAQRAQQQPPTAPAVQAAQIRAQTQEKSDQLKAELTQRELEYKERADQADNALKQGLGEIQLKIEEMRLAGTEKISLMDVKAMLAAKAGELQSRRDEMQLKLAPQNPSHLGI